MGVQASANPVRVLGGRSLGLGLVALALLIARPGLAFADDEPPPVRRASSGGGGGGGGGGRFGIAGSSGIRPIIGVSGHLDVDQPQPVGGNKFLFGADWFIGSGYGLTPVLSFHLGAGGQAFLIHPIFSLVYRFQLPIPLVPYVGGGAGVRLGFKRDQGLNFALSFRGIAGVEYYFTPSIGLSTELVLPDIGPAITPTAGVVGTVEWTIGPHFRF
ncbi:MAG: hypothetical protein U1E65_19745 [Myxococcota bacterium]